MNIEILNPDDPAPIYEGRRNSTSFGDAPELLQPLPHFLIFRHENLT